MTRYCCYTVPHYFNLLIESARFQCVIFDSFTHWCTKCSYLSFAQVIRKEHLCFQYQRIRCPDFLKTCHEKGQGLLYQGMKVSSRGYWVESFTYVLNFKHSLPGHIAWHMTCCDFHHLGVAISCQKMVQISAVHKGGGLGGRGPVPSFCWSFRGNEHFCQSFLGNESFALNLYASNQTPLGGNWKTCPPPLSMCCTRHCIESRCIAH